MNKISSGKIMVGCIGAAGVIIAAIIGLGAPFAQRLADTYFPPITPKSIINSSPEPAIVYITVLPVSPEERATEDITIEKPKENIPTREQPNNQGEGIPIREHYQVYAGDGIFESGTFSDGLAPYTEQWLWDNDHFNIQRIRPEEYPSGCDISRYNTNAIWISGSSGIKFSINDDVVGTYRIADNSHGYIFKWSINIGDRLCVSGFNKTGYHIILGPDMYYHYDSYCYRGNCD